MDVEGLIAELQHREATVRKSAAERLARMGGQASQAIPALLQAAIDIDGEVRETASDALRQIDPGWWSNPIASAAAPGLVLALGGRLEIRQTASYLLSRIGEAAVEELIQALADKGKDGRQVIAARTLGRIGESASRAVPALVRELISEHVHVRQAAAEALSEMGPASEAAVPALVLLLADDFSFVRQAAARALARAGRLPEFAVPGLIQLLPDQEEEVREAAIEALAQVGAGAVPSLIEFLNAPDFRHMEEWLTHRIEGLNSCIDDTEWLERGGALRIQYWPGDPTIEDLRREPVKALRNRSWLFRHAVDDLLRLETARVGAVRALGKLGAAAADAVPVLLETLADKDRRVRLAAVRSLGQVGRGAEAALPALVKALADHNEPIRKTAVEALGKIDANWAWGEAARGSLDFHVETLRGNDEERKAAMDAFAAIGPASVPVLVQALSAESRILRERAATALGRIGLGAREAIPALAKASQDSHRWVREAAAKALQKVGPPSS